ncbi:14313_t:CDS:2, partial [Gigaspora margarita]
CQNALENCYHVLTCTSNSTGLQKAITCGIMKTLKKQQLHTEAKVLQITRIITNNIHLSDPYIPSMSRVILGILPMQATNKINRITQNAQMRAKIAHILLHQISKEIFEMIWKPRCTMIASGNPPRRPGEEAIEEEIAANIQLTSKTLAQLHNADNNDKFNQTKIGIITFARVDKTIINFNTPSIRMRIWDFPHQS